MGDYMVQESTGRQAVRYKAIVVWIHWITAAFVVAQVVIGFTFANMERGPDRMEVFTWHKTIGATILLLALLRLAVRLLNPRRPILRTFQSGSAFSRCGTTGFSMRC